MKTKTWDAPPTLIGGTFGQAALGNKYIRETAQKLAAFETGRAKSREVVRDRQVRLLKEVRTLRAAHPGQFLSANAAAHELLRRHYDALEKWEHTPRVRDRVGRLAIPDHSDRREMRKVREALRKRIKAAEKSSESA